MKSQYLASARATRDAGARFSEALQAGDVVVLEGTLGAGKTTFAQGLAQGLGIEGPVTSPTFALVQEYEGRLPLFHMDLYRLSGSDEFALIGGWEYFSRGGICLIEWADRLGEGLPQARWTVRLDWQPRGRRLTITQESPC